MTVEDANDLDSIRAAMQSFKDTSGKPTIIILKSIIGFGSPNKANSHAAHGAPLGVDEVALTKEAYGWDGSQQFVVPEGVYEHFASGIGSRVGTVASEWHELSLIHI